MGHTPKLDAVASAAVEWWASKRPRFFSVEQHLGNPRVNCNGPREQALAQAVAEWLFDARKRAAAPVSARGEANE